MDSIEGSESLASGVAVMAGSWVVLDPIVFRPQGSWVVLDAIVFRPQGSWVVLDAIVFPARNGWAVGRLAW